MTLKITFWISKKWSAKYPNLQGSSIFSRVKDPVSSVYCYTLIRYINDQIWKWCMKFEKCMKLAQILAESRVIIAQRLLYVGVTKYPKKSILSSILSLKRENIQITCLFSLVFHWRSMNTCYTQFFLEKTFFKLSAGFLKKSHILKLKIS